MGGMLAGGVVKGAGTEGDQGPPSIVRPCVFSKGKPLIGSEVHFGAVHGTAR